MRISLVLRAVTTSWIAVIANASVGFLLTPFVLHHLGDEAFGLWILVVNCVGYYGLLDIGVRSSVLRYVSRNQALGKRDSVNEVVSAAFYYYVCACIFIIIATFASVHWVSHFFPIHAALLPAFKSLYIMAGIVQGVTLPLVVFAGALEAAGRYDQVYMTTVACLVVRVVAVVTALHEGAGLYGVGAATLASQLLSYFVQIPLAFRAHPGLSLWPKWVRKDVFRDMLRYGLVSVTVGIGENLRWYIYPVLVAKFLSPAAVTIFSLPVKILAFPAQGIGTMTEIVNPISSKLEAKNDFAKLRELILTSSQAAFLILIPTAAFFFVFGRELLTLWVGKQYASAYSLLVLLTLGLGTAATQCCIQSMLFGIERHKALIRYRLGEGLSVCILGSVALKNWGLEGFATVIAATLLLTSLVLVPHHLCRILGLSLRRYAVEGYIKPLILILPTAATFVIVHHALPVESWLNLFFSALIGACVYMLTLFLVTFSKRQKAAWYQLGLLDMLAQKLLGAREREPLSATAGVSSGE